MCETAVCTVGLSRSFGSVTALDDSNLSVPTGVIYGLIGPNGAGKTTTLRLLLGLLWPTAGSCEVLGLNPITHGHEVRCRVGAVLEPCGLYDLLSPRENLDYFGRIWHMPASERDARSQELLMQMGLWERRDEDISEWSRGLRQRLCIARSLMHRPALVLMDEPVAGLDATAIEQTAAYLADLATGTGITILMATNNLSVAESTCHSVTILSEGRALASGPTSTVCRQEVEPSIEIDGRGFSDEVLTLLLRRPEVASAYQVNGGVSMQLAGRVDTAPLVSLLVESGVAVSEVRSSVPTLKLAVEALLLRDASEVSVH